jgi:hypothetical protein
MAYDEWKTVAGEAKIVKPACGAHAELRRGS